MHACRSTLEDPTAASEIQLGDLGAGSDWTAFLHHVGIPSLQWTMNGRGAYGVYHSVLDDFSYYERFADSAFVYTPAMAQVMGVAALRLAEAQALPFRYTNYARRIGEYIGSVEATHGIEMPEVREALEYLQTAAVRFEAGQAGMLQELSETGDTARASAARNRLRAAEKWLMRAEQAFIDDAGLAGRPWYQHPISAPGRDTGYDPQPLPEIVEALAAQDATALRAARFDVRGAVAKAASVLSAARRALEK